MYMYLHHIKYKLDIVVIRSLSELLTRDILVRFCGLVSCIKHNGRISAVVYIIQGRKESFRSYDNIRSLSSMSSTSSAIKQETYC